MRGSACRGRGGREGRKGSTWIESERWQAITSLLKQAIGARASMLQDVEANRQTEIDVVNGAIVEAGKRNSVPTPFNDAMVWMVKSLQAKYLAAAKQR